jgi:hypothetical protein
VPRDSFCNGGLFRHAEYLHFLYRCRIKPVYRTRLVLDAQVFTAYTLSYCGSKKTTTFCNMNRIDCSFNRHSSTGLLFALLLWVMLNPDNHKPSNSKGSIPFKSMHRVDQTLYNSRDGNGWNVNKKWKARRKFTSTRASGEWTSACGYGQGNNYIPRAMPTSLLWGRHVDIPAAGFGHSSAIFSGWRLLLTYIYSAYSVQVVRRQYPCIGGGG